MSSLFQILRFATSSADTLGLLYRIQDEDREFLCFTLEDTKRDVKIAGETRIPAGTYELTLRTEGGFHTRYSTSFSAIHAGMIWVRNVPGFEYVLIHVGNTHLDTAGCLLVGDGAKYGAGRRSELIDSRRAYTRVYPIIRDLIRAGPTYLQYVDMS